MEPTSITKQYIQDTWQAEVNLGRTVAFFVADDGRKVSIAEAQKACLCSNCCKEVK